MRNPHQPDLPDDLRRVEERLRQGRVGLSPLEYDGVKRRVRAESAARDRRPNLMRSRLAMAITTAVLLGGAGGAVAISSTDSHATVNGGAASGQYKPGKGCGDKNHTHTGPPGQNDNDADNHSGVNNGSAPQGERDGPVLDPDPLVGTCRPGLPP
jgi:hypothetical protein